MKLHAKIVLFSQKTAKICIFLHFFQDADVFCQFVVVILQRIYKKQERLTLKFCHYGLI